MRLEAKGLVKRYGKRRVVDGVFLQLEPGEIVGLLGPNGAGKTTTFGMIIGFIFPDEGRILFNGTDITRLPMFKRARLGIGYLSQEPSIFRRLTVEENFLAVLELQRLTREEQRKRAEALMEEFGIIHLRRQRAHNLSGGERRRLEIARALTMDPKFVLLDEPFSGIDPIAVSEIQRMIRGLSERGIGVLITDHNVYETLSITNRAYLLYEGKVLLEGTSDFLAKDEQARALYLGEKFRLER
ncbi:MAG: LPS export ABC transporter ATP-binding protein [bacterium]